MTIAMGAAAWGRTDAEPTATDALVGATIVVVDDADSNVVLLQRVLELAGAGATHGVTDSREAVARCLEVRPDLVLLDLHMPHVDGLAVLRALREAIGTSEFLPVLMLTGDTVSSAREQALDAGASDFVTKPFDRLEVIQRVRNLLSMRAMYAEVQRHNAELAAELEVQAELARRATAELEGRRAIVEAALAAGEPRMVFQPIYELEEGRIVAVEALARFDCEPARPPDAWFAEAATAGLGLELELAAVDAALAHLDELPDDCPMTVNASPDTAASPGLAARLTPEIGDRIVLELTEHERILDYPALGAALDRLRENGVRIAVDDAGAGYAGLQQILRLRPDVIKLDLDITRGIDGDPARRALASSLVAFGRDTEALIVAEGIESADELEVLRELGVVWGQGYHLARPGPLPAAGAVVVGAPAVPEPA
jgi:EAL domain-containing protein (putative c-di-GMP-specific phosphodiesterase class I)/DNA-binding response OmpR family regulator